MARNMVWTPEEDIALAKGVKDNVSPLRLATRLRRSVNSVKRRIRDLGLTGVDRDPIVFKGDPILQVRRWLGAAKAKDLNGLVEFYSDEATLECACTGPAVYVGLGAIQEYWAAKLREAEPLAFSLVKATKNETRVIADYLSYEAKPVRMSLSFDASGKIVRSECAPSSCSKPAA
jgi:hypothetical protein